LAVNQLLGAFFGGFLVRANKVDAVRDMPVRAYQVGAVFLRLLSPTTGTKSRPASFIFTQCVPRPSLEQIFVCSS
jgi:hypothetical protein